VQSRFLPAGLLLPMCLSRLLRATFSPHRPRLHRRGCGWTGTVWLALIRTSERLGALVSLARPTGHRG
jgi:hypothetical protein